MGTTKSPANTGLQGPPKEDTTLWFAAWWTQYALVGTRAMRNPNQFQHIATLRKKLTLFLMMFG
jgi:hypothetical protein